MVDKSREIYERNAIEIIEDDDEILWLNEKRIEDRSDHTNLVMDTRKNPSNHRKHRYRQVGKSKKKT